MWWHIFGANWWQFLLRMSHQKLILQQRNQIFSAGAVFCCNILLGATLRRAWEGFDYCHISETNWWQFHLRMTHQRGIQQQRYQIFGSIKAATVFLATPADGASIKKDSISKCCILAVRKISLPSWIRCR